MMMMMMNAALMIWGKAFGGIDMTSLARRGPTL